MSEKKQNRPPLDRRSFLKKGAGSLALTGLAAAGCAPGPNSGQGPAVQAQPKIRWRLASSFPRSLDTIFGSSEVLAERLKAISDGRFEIMVYPQGELVPALQVLDAVQQGTVQVGQSAGYYYTGKNSALAFDTCVPFGLTARQQTAWLTEGGGLDLIRELYADFGVTVFPAGNTGAQMGGWFREEIPHQDGLKGLKMRIPGLGGEVMDRLGVTVQVLPGGDIYPALERGAIDATEWVGPYDDEKLGFFKVAKNYYYPGWWEPGPNLSFMVNLEAWNGLPAAYREMFQTAAAEAATSMIARYDARNPAALQRLREAGVIMRPFSQDLLEAASLQSTDLMESYAAEDPQYRKIYQAWLQFRNASFPWFGLAELSYARYAFGGD